MNLLKKLFDHDYKELNNIASSYIGGNSSTYTSLDNSLFEVCDIITCGFAYPASDGTFTTGDNVNSLNYKYYLPNIQKYVIPKGVMSIYTNAFLYKTIVPYLT